MLPLVVAGVADMLANNPLLNRIVLSKDEMVEICNRLEASMKPGAPALDADFWTRVWDTTEQSLVTSATKARAFRCASACIHAPRPVHPPSTLRPTPHPHALAVAPHCVVLRPCKHLLIARPTRYWRFAA